MTPSIDTIAHDQLAAISGGQGYYDYDDGYAPPPPNGGWPLRDYGDGWNQGGYDSRAVVAPPRQFDRMDPNVVPGPFPPNSYFNGINGDPY